MLRQVRLDSASSSLTNTHYTFAPLSEWLRGQPPPADWPSNIHSPKEVYDWAKANNIDWRTFLDTPRVEAKQTKEVA